MWSMRGGGGGKWGKVFFDIKIAFFIKIAKFEVRVKVETKEQLLVGIGHPGGPLNFNVQALEVEKTTFFQVFDGKKHHFLLKMVISSLKCK